MVADEHSHHGLPKQVEEENSLTNRAAPGVGLPRRRYMALADTYRSPTSLRCRVHQQVLALV
jgi:hypothetical protein